MSHGSAEAASRAAGAAVARRGCGDGRLGPSRFRCRPPARPPRRTRAPDGLLHVQQRRRRRAPRRARWGIQRVAVVDFDVHHGNGTPGDVRRRPRPVLRLLAPAPLLSRHRRRLRTRHRQQRRQRPLRPGSDGTAFRAAWSNIILPELDRFAPGLLIVSAGFDAHKADPLAQLRLETADYAWITQELRAIAAVHCNGGRLVSCPGGGYDLHALAASAATHVRTLMQA